jgi:hypothetical protein
MVNPYRFYTYAYLREDKTPYYIGKGQANRAYKKHKGIRPPKDKTRIIFLKQNLTEEEAFKHEKYMIVVFGRKDLGTGILHNRTAGGEGVSGISEETRRKQSEGKKGEKNPQYGKRGENSPNYGKPRSEEIRRKLSDGKKGENNYWYGRKHSEETVKKMKEAQKGEKHPMYGKSPSEETRIKLSEGKKGENNPMYGKSHSEETRRKQSEANKGKSPSEETRLKMSKSRKGKNLGKKWWNDGNGNSKFAKECPGEGWFPGRGKKKVV